MIRLNQTCVMSTYPKIRSITLPIDTIMIFKYIRTRQALAIWYNPRLMNEDETGRLSFLFLSQHASKSHTFNGVHYRRSPSAEVKPRVTAQKADERINLSQWEKQNCVCVCVHEYIQTLRWECRYTILPRSEPSSTAVLLMLLPQKPGSKGSSTHTKAHLCSPAHTHTHTHTVIVILRHSRLSAEKVSAFKQEAGFLKNPFRFEKKNPRFVTKTWKRPEMRGQLFVPGEYVYSTCGCETDWSLTAV